MEYKIKEIVSFLNDLRVNNNKVWFDANKDRYRASLQQFESLTADLIDGISQFDDSVKGLTVKNCTFRIYRDARFSTNKNPYKTHFGAYISPGGKSSGYAGYYFHIEAEEDGLIGDSILAAGLYGAQGKILESVRTEVFDNPHIFLDNLAKARGFSMEETTKLKRVPKGFPSDFEYADYLKYRDYSLYKSIPKEVLFSDNILDYALGEFKNTAPFIAQLNRAVQYAFEEM